ncbi:mitochondrial phosphatidylserine decarboxylase, partial [Tanacetum coccineum]
VVLEGRWKEGYMAIAAIGATNIGSIKLFIEPDLRTNQPRKKLLQSEAPEERVYEPEGTGLSIKKGEEVNDKGLQKCVACTYVLEELIDELKSLKGSQLNQIVKINMLEKRLVKSSIPIMFHFTPSRTVLLQSIQSY